MLMDGDAIQLQMLDDGICELILDNKSANVNTLSRKTLEELADAVALIQQSDDIRGLLLSSRKESYIVGADITEFVSMFGADEATIVAELGRVNSLFTSLESLPFAVVSAINGIAFGGGCELSLATDFRVMADTAQIGLPEVKLGIFPGWGGTVRLPRVIGVDNANEWICGGVTQRADAALKSGLVDAVVPADQVRDAGIALLKGCIDGSFDYQARRVEKQSPIQLSPIEQTMAFESAKGVIAGKAGPHYPAPMAALAAMQAHANLPLEEALVVEAQGVAKVARGGVARALVGIFLKDQHVKRVSKQYQKQAAGVKQAAVLGAGIMGGGVAYQSAVKGTPILMKDIQDDALELGLNEANKLLAGQLKRGRIDTTKLAKTLNNITPTLSYGDFNRVDFVVEAVVENPKIKKAVLAEVEQAVPADATITSNTSTISITELATALERPENFCGMHFFNPVHKMPLVEVIRGEKTSEAAIAQTVAYAKKMGKTPIVVNDCPGFLVNRILFPYFGGFNALLKDGADFRVVDKVMERFGWPMGPAYLLDVVGIDTAHHAGQVMSEGFPDRMPQQDDNVMALMFAAERYGQKNGRGFYTYEIDRRGKPKKLNDPTADAVLAPSVGDVQAMDEEQIIERMMIPLCIETARCLEEGIVASPAEADMGLIMGIGFPPFRGGPLHYLDTLGLKNFCEMAEKYRALGPLYHPTETMQAMAKQNKTYFG